jgi:hypothetical protein
MGTLVLGMRDRPGLLEEWAASPSVLRRSVHGVEAVRRNAVRSRPRSEDARTRLRDRISRNCISTSVVAAERRMEMNPRLRRGHDPVARNPVAGGENVNPSRGCPIQARFRLEWALPHSVPFLK